MSSAPSILVLGRQGQLATSLQRLGGQNVIAIGRPEFDFANPETISDLLKQYQPEFVVNAAAWTAVDLAETEIEGAKQGNHLGPAYVAEKCALQHIPFIHISTDYVFNGRKGHPYTEDDHVTPETVYGQTKADGEKAVLSVHPQSIILRTSWVYSPYGRNFVRTMINAGAKNPVLKVVNDQKGNPTSSDDLAHIILAIIDKVRQTTWMDHYHGIFHASGQGEATWFDLANTTLEEAALHGQAKPDIRPVSTLDWPTPAKRPADSRLDTTKLTQVFGLRFPLWRESVAKTVQQIFSSQRG
ncbi:dTDP-4-dehydrorhamnose reductase [Aristophania vespae]|uniref:dTDP-4-dehydrorhamnose reductase n=1 Tax=Aristophania vespae TaxID=2697033 RepID=A0A6P1NH93_9PROT|nr:dTDP-4-dehydrorhamnose reductase [Aristophania vespae]QHI96247.1 dTDP-4-dehydrorhamnose reductase [Aristophania vespae]